MGFLDRLFGRGKASEAQQSATENDSFHMQPEPHADEQALQLYRYMLRTAPPILTRCPDHPPSPR